MEDRNYEMHVQLMHGALIQLLSQGIGRTTQIPENGYRHQIYFEGPAALGKDLDLMASGAALLVQAVGQDSR